MSTAQNLAPVVIGRRVDSSFPAEWLDKAHVELEHSDSWACECSDCLAQKQDHVAALSSSYLLKFAEVEAKNSNASVAETVRPPAFARKVVGDV